MDAIEKIRKDVFAYYGGAAYAAQCFEVELRILLWFTHWLKDPKISDKKLDSIEIKLSKKTLGQLLIEMKKIMVIQPDFENLLRVYIKKRNYLAHQFFFLHAENYLTQKGCRAMIDELKELYIVFKEADEIAKFMSRNVRKHLGISEELIKKFAEIELEKVQNIE